MMIGIFRDGVLEMLVTESLDRKVRGCFAISWTCFLLSFRVELCREYWWTSSQVHVNGISQNQYILFPIHQTSDRWLLPQDARDSAEEKTFLDDKTDPNIQIDLFKLLSSLSLWLSVCLNIVTSDPHLLFWIPWTYTPWRRWPAQSKFVWFKGVWREMNAVFLNPKHSYVNSLWKRSLALRLPFTNSLLKWVCCSPFLCHLH